MICLDENIKKLDIENNVIETLNSNEIFKINCIVKNTSN